MLFLCLSLLYFMTILSLLPSYRLYRAGQHTASSLFQRSYSIKHKVTKQLRAVPSSGIELLPPLKLHVFIDGTWLYYSVKGRDNDPNRGCAFKKRLGDDWYYKYRVSWNKLIQIINNNIYKQLQLAHGSSRAVETVKTTVFTSSRTDTDKDSRREMMIEEFMNSNFEVHKYVTAQLQEKCVDISLAVEMLSLATVPDAYDIAVIITGDKDFIPALQKTRSKGKRLGICSMRVGCSRDLLRPDLHVKDFDVIWIEDYIDEFVVKKQSSKDVRENLINIIREVILSEGKNTMNSRELGRNLQKTSLPEQQTNALSQLKASFFSLRAFLEKYSKEFKIIYNEDKTIAEFIVEVRPDATVIDDDDDIDGMSDDKGFADAMDASDEYFDTTEEEDEEDEEDGDTQSDVTTENEDVVEEQPEMESEENLLKLTVPELKEMLKAKGLSLSGRKQELVDRIVSSRNEAVSNDISAHDYDTLITDFLIKSNPERKSIHTRVLGKYLGQLPHNNGGSILNSIKQEHGGLESFIEGNDKFTLDRKSGHVKLK